MFSEFRASCQLFSPQMASGFSGPHLVSIPTYVPILVSYNTVYLNRAAYLEKYHSTLKQWVFLTFKISQSNIY